MSPVSFVFMAALPLIALGFLAAQANPAYGIPFLLVALGFWLLNQRLRRRG